MSAPSFPYRLLARALMLCLLAGSTSIACLSGSVREPVPVDPGGTEGTVEEQAIDQALNESGDPDAAQPGGNPIVQPTPEQLREASRFSSNRADNKGRKVSTTFSGYELIREVTEDEFGIKSVKITINGNATIRHDRILITARRMVIVDGTKGELVGGVRIYDRESGVKVYAARADYDRDEQVVHLTGKPYLTVQQGKNKPTLVSCTKITRDLAAKEAILDGDVRIHHDGWSILGERGVYADAEDRVVLESNPFLFGRGQFMSGDRLVYAVGERQVSLDGQIAFLTREANQFSGVVSGNASKDTEAAVPLPGLEEYARKGGAVALAGAEGAISGADSRPEGNDDIGAVERPLTMMTAGQIVHSFSDGEEPRTEVKGDVLLTSGESLQITTPYLVALGRDFNTIHTEEGVEMRDRSQNMFVTAGVMDYSQDEELLRLEGDPEIEFYKAGTEDVEATLRGAVIQRDFAAENTAAWGGVEIERENTLATGEIATFYEDADVIVLEGDPGLRDGASQVRCEKILFYPEKNRILLYNRIRGYLGGQ